LKTRFLYTCLALLAFGSAAVDTAALQQPGAAPQQPQRPSMDTMENPIAPADLVWMEQMTVIEVRDAIRSGMTNVLILTGGVESNGPFLPTGKHNYMLQANGEAIARKMGNTLVAPVVTIEPGNPETARSPGGIRFSAETYRAVLRDYAVSLKAQGFKSIFFIGDSGGNQGPMRTVAQELNTEWAGQGVRAYYIPEYYTEDQYSCNYIKEVLGVMQLPDRCAATRDLYHDDYHHTAIIAPTDPERIRPMQRLAAGEFSINGVDLAPLAKTIENGKRLVEYRAELTVRAMRAAVAAGAG
jgi:creatinine amidohydrolase/Fe(II)-dependent formamide hydrolase-like protein